ncbi:MAG: hypothetical protein ACAI44_15205 [Candidatus Sericytochromatia bacterium]
MNVQIDDKILEQLARKTGQPKQVFLDQVSALAQAHFLRLLGEAEQLDAKDKQPDRFETQEVLEVMDELMTEYADAFHELAR